MKPSECLDKIINIVKAQDLPRGYKDELLDDLSYFRQQAELEISARAHPAEISKRWTLHYNKTKSISVYSVVQKNDHLWRTLQCFVFAGEPTDYLIPKHERKSEPAEKYHSMDAEAFFIHIETEVAKSRTILDQRFVEYYFALKVLQSEARHARGRRSKLAIDRAARWIHPGLFQLRIMDEFRNEWRLQQTVNFFINDEIHTRFNFFQKDK